MGKDKQKILNMYFATHKTCNMSCSYCYVPQKYKNTPKPKDSDIIAALKDFIQKVETEDYRIGSFCLHGSEPTLMQAISAAKIVDLVDEHWKKSKCCTALNVAIQTNGLNLTEDYLNELEKYLGNPKRLRIGFSIDPPKYIHDKYRNNTFDKIISHYDDARSRGFPVSVLSVVTKDTMDYLEEFAKWMQQQIVLKEKYGNPYKVKMKLATGELSLSEEQTAEFAEFLIKYSLLNIVQLLTPGYCLQAGNECMWFEFDTDGNCYSCNKNYNEEGVFSNWKNEHFDEIYAKRKNLFINYNTHAACSSCPYEFLCNSGCPADRIKSGESAGLAHECIIIKRAFEETDRRGLHITDFYNNN